MTVHFMERDAYALAAQYGHFAVRHILQTSGSNPSRHLLKCIKDCCEYAPTGERAAAMRVQDIFSAFEMQNEVLKQLSAILFAVETDRSLIIGESESFPLGRQARHAMKIFAMLPALDAQTYKRINIAEHRICPNPFAPIMQVLLRKIATHWAIAEYNIDARPSLAFLVEHMRSGEPEETRTMVVAALREADSEASIERIAQAIHLVSDTLPSHNSSRATVLKNLAIAMARNATASEIHQIASVFVT